MKKIILTSIVALAAGSALMAAAVNTAGCKGCHGQNFEKKALGKSAVVKDMTHAEIASALKGYKVGKGGSMKGIMKGQVSKYSDAELDAFAQTIGK